MNSFRSLFEMHPDVVLAMDLYGRVMEANAATQAFLGYAPESWARQNFTTLFAPDRVERAWHQYGRALRGESRQFETVVVRADGTRRDVYATFVPHAEQGTRKSVFAILQDASSQTFRPQSRWEQDPLPEFGSWHMDLVHGRLHCSVDLRALFGVNMSEVDSFEKFLSYVHPSDHPLVHQAVEAALQGEPYVLECRIVRPDGEVRMMRSQGRAVFEPSGQPLRLKGNAFDVTDGELAKHRLLVSEERYRLITDHSQDMIVTLNPLGERIFVSPSCRSMLGYEPEELVGNTVFEQCHPDDALGLRGFFTEILTERVPTPHTFRIRRKDGNYIWVEVAAKTLRDEAGKMIEVISVCRDVTERKKTEELLLQSEKLSVIGQLAAGIAHEIRNPLTSLKGFIQLMQQGESRYANYLDVMFSELNRIELIVGELLVLAKPQQLSFKEVDLIAVLQDVITIIATQAILSGTVICTDWDLDSLHLEGDPNQLKQVFINFLKNSIEAMPEGGELMIRVRKHGEVRVQISFFDQGCGISAERLAKLGEPFYTTKEKGTGLGLMVSKKILENHGGEMHVDSVVGAGTAIHVTLPVSRRQAGEKKELRA